MKYPNSVWCASRLPQNLWCIKINHICRKSCLHILSNDKYAHLYFLSVCELKWTTCIYLHWFVITTFSDGSLRFTHTKEMFKGATWRRRSINKSAINIMWAIDIYITFSIRFINTQIVFEQWDNTETFV